MSEPRPDRVLRLLIGWITYLLIFSWLPLVRAVFDGSTYRWGTTHFGHAFGSAGLGPDVWLLVFTSALLITLLWLALRRRGQIFRWLLLAWSATLALDAIYLTVTAPDSLEFHGDTLGIHLNLGPAVIAFFVGFAALALFWVLRRSEREPIAVSWQPANTKLLVALLLLLPIQFILLRFGEPHGTTDAIGVLITIAQCPLLAVALSARQARSAGG
jgi:hypothetical protein